MFLRSRTECAFEAVFLYALAALGERANKYEYPNAEILKSAAETMGLTALQIAPAISYLVRRYGLLD